MKNNVVAMATAKLVAAKAAASNSGTNWLKRLQSITVHPKVPAQMKQDIAKVLQERELLRQYYAASKACTKLVNIAVTDDDFPDAMNKLADLNKKFEAARNVCNEYGDFDA